MFLLLVGIDMSIGIGRFHSPCLTRILLFYFWSLLCLKCTHVAITTVDSLNRTKDLISTIIDNEVIRLSKILFFKWDIVHVITLKIKRSELIYCCILWLVFLNGYLMLIESLLKRAELGISLFLAILIFVTSNNYFAFNWFDR